MPPKRKVPPKMVAPKKQMMTQTLLQQQLQLNSLRVFRELQLQQKSSKSALLISLSTLILSLFAVYFVFRKYGLAFAFSLAVLLYRLKLMSFLDVAFNWVVSRNDMVSYSNALRRADIMSEPITKKFTEKGENEFLSYACSCMQGWRRTMEDSHTNVLLENGGFFGVYDGHSGAETAKFCGANMYDYISKSKSFAKGEITSALHDGFISIDKYLYSLPDHEKSGCTACVLYVAEDQLYCANAGDSRCILCRNGEAFPLSNDHKPFLESEQTRIERAGGYIWNRRVNGILALSRAIGDFGFKKNSQVSWDQQAVTSAPEVRSTHLNRDTDEFAVVACDGIWDMRSNEQVVEFVRHRIQQRFPLNVICEQLMDSCLSPVPFGLGCDNMSVIIVQFKRRAQTPRVASKMLSRNNSSDPDEETGKGKTGDTNRDEETGDRKYEVRRSERASAKATPMEKPLQTKEGSGSFMTTAKSTQSGATGSEDSLRIGNDEAQNLSESQSEMDQLREFVNKTK